jgi:hypothetical protein
LEVDNRIVLPIKTHIRVLVSAADVLHSWAVPSLGVKMDACPGRLNQTSMFINREGVYYGQCSEICGVNHGFMPIVVRSENLDTYGMEMWFLRALEKLEDGLITFDGDALEGLERIIRIVENLRAYNPEFLDFITFNSIGDKVSYTFKPGNSQLEFEFFVFLYSQAVYKSSVIAEQEGREETYEDFIKGVSFVSEDYGCSTFNINVKFNDCATCV